MPNRNLSRLRQMAVFVARFLKVKRRLTCEISEGFRVSKAEIAASKAGSASARSASQSALIAPATAAASFATASSLATSS